MNKNDRNELGKALALRSVKITKAQLKSIISLRDDIESMVGCSDESETDNTWKRHVRNIDRFLDKNNLTDA